MGTVPAYAPSREAMGLHARGAERRKEIDSVGAALRFQLADVLHVQGTADGAERREDYLDGMVRQLAGKQEQSQSKGRRLLGRSDLAGNAVHGCTVKPELTDWPARRSDVRSAREGGEIGRPVDTKRFQILLCRFHEPSDQVRLVDC